MWLFTRYGFFSIACANQIDGSVDPQTIMVRARRKGHLQKLQSRFPLIAPEEIVTSPERDYRYRLIVSKAAWVAIAAELAEEQDWSNFKNEAGRLQGGPVATMSALCMPSGMLCTAFRSQNAVALQKK